MINKEDAKKRKTNNKKLPNINQPNQPKVEEEERYVQSEDGTRRKPRMPWLKKKKKVESVGKEFFDNWIEIPPEVLRAKNEPIYKNTRSAPTVWTPGREGFVGYYSG